MRVRASGTDRQGMAHVDQLELEPLELEQLVRRRYRAGWSQLEVAALEPAGERVVARIAPKRPRGRQWWCETPLGIGQQRLEL